MPASDQDESAGAALQISDNLLQDMQGLLLRLYASSDELRGLLDRVDQVITEARERIGAVAPTIGETRDG